MDVKSCSFPALDLDLDVSRVYSIELTLCIHPKCTNYLHSSLTVYFLKSSSMSIMAIALGKRMAIMIDMSSKLCQGNHYHRFVFISSE